MRIAALSFLALMVGATPSTARDYIVRGDWAANCIERVRDGRTVVYCDRYGGFVNNVFPPGCEGNNVFVCRGMTLCDVARYVSIIDPNDYTRLQSDVELCTGTVRPAGRRN